MPLVYTIPKVFIGLGNPGDQYNKTRHNLGYEFLDHLSKHHQFTEFKHESKVFGSLSKSISLEQEVILFRPSKYMNESGESIRNLLNYYRIDLSEVCVIHDDLDLEPGVMRIKYDGGHGGHNGLRSIFKSCQGSAFLRIRIGIGHPEYNNVIDYVLSKPKVAEAETIHLALDSAIDATDCMLKDGVEKAMSIFNQKV